MTIAPMGTGQNRDVLFYDPEAEAKIKQMRKAAELMRENSKMGAPNEMAGRVVYKKSPLEYLARMGSSLIAGNEERKAEESDAAYKKRRSEMLAQAVQSYGEDPSQMAKIMMQDPSMMGAGIGIMSDAQKMKLEQDKLKREQDLIAAGYMPGKDFQSQLYNRLLPSMGVSGAANAASAMQTFTGPDGAIYRAPSRNVPPIDAPQQGFGLGGQVPSMNDVPNPQTPQQISSQVPDVVANQPDALGNTVGIIEQMQPPAVTPNAGTMVVPGKTPEQKAQEAANLARATAEGRAAGEASALADKNVVSAGNRSDIISEAEKLIGSGTGSLPASLITAGRSKFLGQSTEESRANAGLKALGGRLVSMMPRMEGPQSNYDVQLYTEMAGNIADPTVPAEDKLAALEAIKALDSKYSVNVPSSAPASTPAEQALPAGVSAEDWKYMTPEERALFQ